MIPGNGGATRQAATDAGNYTPGRYLWTGLEIVAFPALRVVGAEVFRIELGRLVVGVIFPGGWGSGWGADGWSGKGCLSCGFVLMLSLKYISIQPSAADHVGLF